MELNFGFFQKGVELKSENRNFRLEYPQKVWEHLSIAEKESFLDNIAYLSTVCMPLVSGANKAEYSTSKPFFRNEFDKSVLEDIPSAVDEYKQNAKEMLEKFRKTRYVFAKGKAKIPVFNARTNERAVIPFSCGKDSLLTLAVCDEIGLDPVPVYINDTVSPSENRLKLKFIKKIAKQKRLGFAVVKNEIEKLNDFEFWEKPEADIGYSHMVMSFCFTALPIAKFYNARHIVLGNELDLNDKFVTKEGIKCYPSFDQSFEGTKRLNRIIRRATNGKAGVTSVISPLYDLAIVKILHARYPDLAKYQLSCPGLDASKEKRWCSACTDCVRFTIYMLANRLNPKLIGLKRNVFEKRFMKYHVIFNKKAKGRYEKASGDEQMKFAYYLAYKNGAKGYLMDLFRKKYLDEIKQNEDRLYKKYFSVHSTELIPAKLRKSIVSIYKEQLSCF